MTQCQDCFDFWIDNNLLFLLILSQELDNISELKSQQVVFTVTPLSRRKKIHVNPKQLRKTKIKNITGCRKLLYKLLVQVSGLYVIPYSSYPLKCFTQIQRAQYGIVVGAQLLGLQHGGWKSMKISGIHSALQVIFLFS